MRQTQKPKDATPIKEEAYEEEFSDGEEQFKRQQNSVQNEPVRRKTTIGTMGGDFDRDSDSGQIEEDRLKVESELSKSKNSKDASFGKNEMQFGKTTSKHSQSAKKDEIVDDSYVDDEFEVEEESGSMKTSSNPQIINNLKDQQQNS